MIIERKYEYFGRLIERDPKAKAIYEKACAYKHNASETKRIYEYNLNNRAFEMEMGCGIIDPNIIWNGYAELDKSDPYDNGFSLNDANDIYIMNRSVCEWNEQDEPAWIEYALVWKFEDKEYIVKVARVQE